MVKKIKLKNIFEGGVLFLIIFTYLTPGFIQFFLGVPATLYSYILILFLYAIIGLDLVIRQKVILNSTIYLYILYLVLMIIVGFYNRTSFIKVVLYSVFCLIPFGFYYFSKIIKHYNFQLRYNNLVRFIILIQLPIVLCQKYGYDFFIKFSNAAQGIKLVDFIFGSFSIKADHALGFLFITYILSVFINKNRGVYTKAPFFMIGYVTILIFLMNSNLTKLVFVLIVLYFLGFYLYKKMNFLSIGVLVLITYFTFISLVKYVPAVESQLYHFQHMFTPEQSKIAVLNGYAKRPQVVINQLYHEPFKILGNGPYDYYNLLTGEFKSTIHFSQMIWTYNDLGLLGLILILVIAYRIVKNMELERKHEIIVSLVLLLYLFMTNVYGDVSMLLTLFLMKVSFLNTTKD